MEKVLLYLCGLRVVSMRTEVSCGLNRPHSEAQARAVLTLSSRGVIWITQSFASTACTLQSNVASSSSVMRTWTCFFHRSSCSNGPLYRSRMVGGRDEGGLESAAPVSMSERSSTETSRRSALLFFSDSASCCVAVFCSTLIRRFTHPHMSTSKRTGCADCISCIIQLIKTEPI